MADALLVAALAAYAGVLKLGPVALAAYAVVYVAERVVAPRVDRVLALREGEAARLTARREEAEVVIPPALRAVIDSHDEEWARADAEGRVRELYAEHQDWTLVAAALHRERQQAQAEASAHLVGHLGYQPDADWRA